MITAISCTTSEVVDPECCHLSHTCLFEFPTRTRMNMSNFSPADRYLESTKPPCVSNRFNSRWNVELSMRVTFLNLATFSVLSSSRRYIWPVRTESCWTVRSFFSSRMPLFKTIDTREMVSSPMNPTSSIVGLMISLLSSPICHNQHQPSEEKTRCSETQSTGFVDPVDFTIPLDPWIQWNRKWKSPNGASSSEFLSSGNFQIPRTQNSCRKERS